MKKDTLITLIQGACIGIANIIPGVSGGTIAFILGIYQKLIVSITNINLETIKSLKYIFNKDQEQRKKFYEAMGKINFFFLLKLVTGAVIAIFSLSFLFTYLLVKQHDSTYGFFFGLVLVSIIFPYKLLEKIRLKEIISFILAALFVVILARYTHIREQNAAVTLQKKFANSSDLQEILIKKGKQKNASKLLAILENKHKKTTIIITDLFIYFCAAAVVISAMILPGISGSFLLLLMGLYFDILHAIKTFNIPILMTFSLGCAVGLILFTRLLNYILKYYYNATLAFLTGLIAGSLYGIWPFKTLITIKGMNFYGCNILPVSFDFNFIMTIITCLSGAGLVFLLFMCGEKLRDSSTT